MEIFINHQKHIPERDIRRSFLITLELESIEHIIFRRTIFNITTRNLLLSPHISILLRAILLHVSTLTTPITTIPTGQTPTLVSLTTPRENTTLRFIALSLRSRVRNPLILRSIRITLSGKLLLNLRMNMLIGPIIAHPNPFFLLLKFGFFYSLGKRMRCEISMYSTSIVMIHSSSTNSDTPFMNLFIKSLGLSTKDGAYIDQRVNFKAYSLRLKFSCLRLMNSSNVASPNSLGKNLSRKLDLKVSNSIGPTTTILQDFHCSYKIWATSFN